MGNPFDGKGLKESLNLFKTMLKAGERRKTQEPRTRLHTSQQKQQSLKKGNEHETALPNGLFDFADESLEFEQSAAVVGDLPIIPTPLTGISHEAEVNHGTVLSNNVLSPSSLSSFLRGQNIEKPALQYFSSVSWKLLLRRLYSNSHPPNLHYCVFTTTLQLTTNKLNPNSSSHFLLYSMIGQLISMCNNQN